MLLAHVSQLKLTTTSAPCILNHLISFNSNRIVCHSFFSFLLSLSIFHSSSLLRSSDVNVVFTFIISLNDFAPSAPILLSVIHSFRFFFFPISHFPHNSDSEMSMWCSLSAFQSLILLLQLQSHYLLFILLCISSFSFPFFFFPHNLDSVMPLWCSISSFHSLILLLQLQSYCLSSIHCSFSFSHFLILHFLLLRSRPVISVCFSNNPISVAHATVPSVNPVHTSML